MISITSKPSSPVQMTLNSGVGWTGITWNFIRGCKMKSTECINCYMYREYGRFGLGDPSIVVRTSKTAFNKPLRAQREVEAGKRRGYDRLVFACSWSDWNNEEGDPYRDDAWDIIRKCPDLVFQILTKEPQRFADNLPSYWDEIKDRVWMGVSIGHPSSSWRIEALQAMRDYDPAVLFISFEPLVARIPQVNQWAKDGWFDWGIVGGESGPPLRNNKIRIMHPFWSDEVIGSCIEYGIGVFFKQWGEYKYMMSPPTQYDSKRAALINVDGTVKTDIPKSGFYPNGTWASMYRLGKLKSGNDYNGMKYEEFPALPPLS